jgi:arginine N-succinyltransferase
MSDVTRPGVTVSPTPFRSPSGARVRPLASTDNDAWGSLRDLETGGPLQDAPGARWWCAESDDGTPMAALRLRPRIGEPVPQAWFRLGWAVHASAELGLYRRQRTLLLGHDLTGADELAGWALAPVLTAAEAGPWWAALIAQVLAEATPEPGQPVIAALPGTRDAAGRSPVWQGLGRHFHAQEPDAAVREHGPDWACHVAPLLPRHQLYASLLPLPAQAGLGVAAAVAQPLRAALHAAGFDERGHVGIVDGGPVLERWPREGSGAG